MIAVRSVASSSAVSTGPRITVAGTGSTAPVAQDIGATVASRSGRMISLLTSSAISQHDDGDEDNRSGDKQQDGQSALSLVFPQFKVTDND